MVAGSFWAQMYFTVQMFWEGHSPKNDCSTSQICRRKYVVAISCLVRDVDGECLDMGIWTVEHPECSVDVWVLQYRQVMLDGSYISWKVFLQLFRTCHALYDSVVVPVDPEQTMKLPESAECKDAMHFASTVLCVLYIRSTAFYCENQVPHNVYRLGA